MYLQRYCIITLSLYIILLLYIIFWRTCPSRPTPSCSTNFYTDEENNQSQVKQENEDYKNKDLKMNARQWQRQRWKDEHKQLQRRQITGRSCLKQWHYYVLPFLEQIVLLFGCKTSFVLLCEPELLWITPIFKNERVFWSSPPPIRRAQAPTKRLRRQKRK